MNVYIFIMTIGIIPLSIIEFQYRDPSSIFIPKITLSLIIFGFILWFLTSDNDNNKNSQQNFYYNNNANRHINYCEQIQKNRYDEITEETTRRELDKLTMSERFMEMFEEKGDNQKNWSWQSREKYTRFNESQINSYDIENLTTSTTK